MPVVPARGLLAVFLFLAGGGSQPPAGVSAGLFDGLSGVPGVEVLADGYGLRLTWDAESYTVRLPGVVEPAVSGSGSEPQRLAVYVECVVDPSPAAYPSAVSLGAILRLPAHPDAVGVRGLGAPAGWMFLLTLRAVDRVPVRVQLGSLAPFDAVVRMWRTRLPGVDPAPSASLAVAAEGVLQLLVDGEPADLRLEGLGVVVDAAFPARADLAVPAAEAQRYCAT